MRGTALSAHPCVTTLVPLVRRVSGLAGLYAVADWNRFACRNSLQK